MFRCSSVNVRTGVTSDYKDDVDFFCVYVPELDKCYLIDILIANKSEMTLRLSATKNNQDHLAHWAKDFELCQATFRSS